MSFQLTALIIFIAVFAIATAPSASVRRGQERSVDLWIALRPGGAWDDHERNEEKEPSAHRRAFPKDFVLCEQSVL